MLKIFLLPVVVLLLFISGCGLPSIINPFKYPCRIVPECSGRITDLKGRPLPGVRVRIFSYDKISSAVSDADGRFTLSPLYKWVSFQNDLTMYDSLLKRLHENESIAGRRHLLLGELALFFETPKEHFLLLGANYFPERFTNFKNIHIAWSHTKNMLYLCIPDWNKNGKKSPVITEPEPLCFCNFFDSWNTEPISIAEKIPPNPWDHFYYKLYKRIGWEMYKKEQKIIAPQTIVTFDSSFIQWMKSKAISEEMLKIAEENLDEDIYY